MWVDGISKLCARVSALEEFKVRVVVTRGQLNAGADAANAQAASARMVLNTIDLPNAPQALLQRVWRPPSGQWSRF